jgi:hypothetical protein
MAYQDSIARHGDFISTILGAFGCVFAMDFVDTPTRIVLAVGTVVLVRIAWNKVPLY